MCSEWLATWESHKFPKPEAGDEQRIRKFISLKYKDKKWYKAGGGVGPDCPKPEPISKILNEEPKLVVNKTSSSAAPGRQPPPPPKPPVHDLLDFAFEEADAGPQPSRAIPPARPGQPPPAPAGQPPGAASGGNLSGLLGALDISDHVSRPPNQPSFPAEGGVVAGPGAVPSGGSNPFADDDDDDFASAFTPNAVSGAESSDAFADFGTNPFGEPTPLATSAPSATSWPEPATATEPFQQNMPVATDIAQLQDGLGWEPVGDAGWASFTREDTWEVNASQSTHASQPAGAGVAGGASGSEYEDPFAALQDTGPLPAAGSGAAAGGDMWGFAGGDLSNDAGASAAPNGLHHTAHGNVAGGGGGSNGVLTGTGLTSMMPGGTTGVMGFGGDQWGMQAQVGMPNMGGIQAHQMPYGGIATPAIMGGGLDMGPTRGVGLGIGAEMGGGMNATQMQQGGMQSMGGMQGHQMNAMQIQQGQQVGMQGMGGMQGYQMNAMQMQQGQQVGMHSMGGTGGMQGHQMNAMQMQQGQRMHMHNMPTQHANMHTVHNMQNMHWQQQQQQQGFGMMGPGTMGHMQMQGVGAGMGAGLSMFSSMGGDLTGQMGFTRPDEQEAEPPKEPEKPDIFAGLGDLKTLANRANKVPPKPQTQAVDSLFDF